MAPLTNSSGWARVCTGMPSLDNWSTGTKMSFTPSSDIEDRWPAERGSAKMTAHGYDDWVKTSAACGLGLPEAPAKNGGGALTPRDWKAWVCASWPSL